MANGFLEFIHIDHLSSFHLLPAAWTGVLSGMRQEWTEWKGTVRRDMAAGSTPPSLADPGGPFSS